MSPTLSCFYDSVRDTYVLTASSEDLCYITEILDCYKHAYNDYKCTVDPLGMTLLSDNFCRCINIIAAIRKTCLDTKKPREFDEFERKYFSKIL